MTPLVEKVVRAMCGRDLKFFDCERACMAANKCVGKLSQCIIDDAQAAITAIASSSHISAAKPEDRELVARLREAQPQIWRHPFDWQLMQRAADRIESLSHIKEALEKLSDSFTGGWAGMYRERAEVIAEVERIARAALSEAGQGETK